MPLTEKEYKKRIKAFTTPSKDKALILKLPVKLRKIVFGAMGKNEKGKSVNWEKSPQLVADSTNLFEALSKADRTKIFKTLRPKLATEIEKTWQFLHQSSSQQFGERPFRAPKNPEYSLSGRLSWLTGFLEATDSIAPTVLSPEWLATWVVPMVNHGSNWWLSQYCIPMVACAINQGGKRAKSIVDILIQSGNREHEIGDMGQHVPQILLRAKDPRGWEFVEKLLVSAQRQEGLRQSILSAVTHAHPEAAKRIYQVLVENRMARFSAITHFLNGHLGYRWDSASTGVINKVLESMAELLTNPAACKKALAADDPERVFLSLWAIATEDMTKLPTHIKKLLSHKNVEFRYVAAKMLGMLGEDLASLNSLRAIAYRDEDLRVAITALPGNGYYYSYEDSTTSDKKVFEALEELLQRVPKKATKQKPLVWPWAIEVAKAETVGAELLGNLGTLPVDRLIPYVKILPADLRGSAIDLMARSKKWSDELRQTVFQAIGSTSGSVAHVAAEAFRKRKLLESEVLELESLLTRKSTTTRAGVVGLLQRRGVAEQIESAERLLTGTAQQRLGGLEIVRQLVESKKSVKRCRELVETWAAGRKKSSKEEETQIETILDAAKPQLTLENGLGFFEPKNLSDGERPKVKKVPLLTKAALNLIYALDALAKKHAKEIITYTNWNGEECEVPFSSASMPAPDLKVPFRKQKKNFPLADVWIDWFEKRPKNCRDKDGMELVRANILLEHNNWRGKWEIEGLTGKKNPNRDLLKAIFGFDKNPQSLKFSPQVSGVVQWLAFIHPVAKLEQYQLDALEYICTLVPDSAIKQLTDKKFKALDHWYRDGRDFRTLRAVTAWFPNPNLEKMPRSNFERYWKILNWLDKPAENAVRQRPPYEVTVRAYQLKLASFDDVAEQLIGPPDSCRWSNFSMLSELTQRKLSASKRKMLQKTKKLAELVESVKECLLETELNRGQKTTVASSPVQSISTIYGVENLIRILTMLGKEKFKKSYYGESKAQALTSLVGKTFPHPDDTQASFDKQFKAAIKENAFPAERVLEVSFHAPQWSQLVQGYLKWKGMAEATYWFLAHMSYWGGGLENAIVGTEYDQDSEARDDDSSKPTGWERLILERTDLTHQQRGEGVIDVQWFHKIHSELGSKRFDEMAAAARYAATPAAAKKAKYIADVLTGVAEREELFEKIETRKLKEHVRLLGLLPLPKLSRNRDKDIQERYSVLMEYQKYARGLSSLSKPGAMRAAEIGLENMARTAGFLDPMRMQWALEAESTKDLKDGFLEATKDDVLLRMDLDPRCVPVTTIQRAGKILKNLPAKYRKEPAFVAIRERAKLLKTQGTRIRRSLETAMVRGDVIDAKELKQLAEHAVLWPMLSRLVLINGSIMGYPDKKGKALRDFGNRLEPIKAKETFRIAHPSDLLKSRKWSNWQRECFQSERIQPFKQLFRELYVVSAQEKKDKTVSRRYAGQQIQPRQASALWSARGWQVQDQVWKSFPDVGINVDVQFEYGWGSPVEVEGLTIENVRFSKRDQNGPLKLTDVPPILFSEVMRDMDLVVSVAHRGEVDPEASASTVEMRVALIEETNKLLGLKNVTIKKNHAMIEGQHGSYSLHLGSGVVHRMPGGHVCIVPVHGQHRGRIFLPFSDDDPKTAEVISKILLLSKDNEIQDPTILEQLRAASR